MGIRPPPTAKGRLMLLEGIAKKTFVVVGRVGMDFFPAPGVRTREATSMQTGMGGSSANIAAGLCKFGCNAALVTRVIVFCISCMEIFVALVDGVVGEVHEHRRALLVSRNGRVFFCCEASKSFFVNENAERVATGNEYVDA